MGTRVWRPVILALAIAAMALTARGARADAHVRAACSPATGSTSGRYADLVADQNGFGFRLLRTLARGNGNTLISPVSIATALDMAYDGARGGTETAMAKTLGVRGLTPDKTRAQAAALLSALRPRGSDGLFMANSLWAQRELAFQPLFMQHVRTSYGATVRRLDLHSPSAPATINAWVSCATRGKISSIVDSIPAQTVLYLINAVYFRGSWDHPFNLSRTRPRTFTTGSGAMVKAPTMRTTGSFGYEQVAGSQMAVMNYVGSKFAMVILLPNRGKSLRSVTAGLTESRWTDLLGHIKAGYGTIFLPRFSLVSDYNLIPPLSALGMGSAFADSADFSGMCIQPCKISSVRHRALLSVNEKGTIGAATTAVGVVPTISVNSPPPIPFVMVVNRPFIAAVLDRGTGGVPFIAAVNDPRG